MTKREVVYRFVSRIPKGKVTTYGGLAKISGVKSPRVVGSLLHRNPDPEKIPCHRVVNGEGFVAANFAFGGAIGQTKRLEKEGVTFTKGRVNLSKHFWHQ